MKMTLATSKSKAIIMISFLRLLGHPPLRPPLPLPLLTASSGPTTSLEALLHSQRMLLQYLNPSSTSNTNTTTGMY